MALYNEILAGRYNRFLQKLLSMKGEAPAPQLAGEIMAAFSLFNGAENRYLEGWNRFANLKSFAASAANFNQFRIRNPAASNVIAVLEKVVVGAAAADAWDMTIGVTAADLATPSNTIGSRFDPRGNPQSSMSISFQQTAATNQLPASQMRVFFVANSQAEFITTDIQEIPLLPGDAYHFNGNTVNVAQTIALWWRERFLEDSERT